MAACAAEAKGYRDAGFRAVKMKVGLLSVDDDLKRVAAARDVIAKQMTAAQGNKLIDDGIAQVEAKLH